MKNNQFNNYSAIYFLLYEKLKKKKLSFLNIMSSQPKKCPTRRPSSIADQTVESRPVLHLTKQTLFNYTTDCYQGSHPTTLHLYQNFILQQHNNAVSIDEGLGIENDLIGIKENSFDQSLETPADCSHDSFQSLSTGSADSFNIDDVSSSKLSSISQSPSASQTTKHLEYTFPYSFLKQGGSSSFKVVRKARSPVNFREGRRASDEYLAANAIPFRQYLAPKVWLNKKVHIEDGEDCEPHSRSKICKVEIPSNVALKQFHQLDMSDEENKKQDVFLYQKLQTLKLNSVFMKNDTDKRRRWTKQCLLRQGETDLLPPTMEEEENKHDMHFS